MHNSTKGRRGDSDLHHLRTEPEAEKVIIGALLLSATNGDENCASRVFSALQAPDFSDSDLGTNFAALAKMHENGIPFEPRLVLSQIKGRVEHAAAILAECGAATVTTATVDHYVELVAQAARQRRLVLAANDALDAASKATHPAALDDAIDDIADSVADLKRGNARGVELVCIGDIEPEPVEWLWPGRIPIGKVTLFAGDPGLGKSLLTLDIAARISRGAAWPDSSHEPRSVGGVVLLSAEDDVADTIRPRLDAHDADCSRVFELKSLADLGRDIDRMSLAIDRTPDCRLVIVDPISAYMGRADSHVNAEVRAVLAPLAALAAEKRVAILAVTHLRKGEGAAIYRAMGSLAFVAAARAAWVVCRDKTNSRRRLFLPVKNNLAADTSGLAFTIEDHGPDNAPVVCWERDVVTITADEAMAPEPKKRGRRAEEREEAEQWLRETLADGPRLTNDVTREATEARCISKRTLERAKMSLGVDAFRYENPGPWWWRLPDESHSQNGESITPVEELWHSGDLPQNSGHFNYSEGSNGTSP